MRRGHTITTYLRLITTHYWGASPPHSRGGGDGRSRTLYTTIPVPRPSCGIDSSQNVHRDCINVYSVVCIATRNTHPSSDKIWSGRKAAGLAALFWSRHHHGHCCGHAFVFSLAPILDGPIIRTCPCSVLSRDIYRIHSARWHKVSVFRAYAIISRIDPRSDPPLYTTTASLDNSS